jgi:Adaptor complexes medium subunit family
MVLFDSIFIDYARRLSMRSHIVHGKVNFNCRLSGMPDVIVQFSGMGNAMGWDDQWFHPSVRFHGKQLRSIPPDGKSTLLEYEEAGQAYTPLKLQYSGSSKTLIETFVLGLMVS